jgi:hypothetical protein
MSDSSADEVAFFRQTGSMQEPMRSVVLCDDELRLVDDEDEESKLLNCLTYHFLQIQSSKTLRRDDFSLTHDEHSLAMRVLHAERFLSVESTTSSCGCRERKREREREKVYKNPCANEQNVPTDLHLCIGLCSIPLEV